MNDVLAQYGNTSVLYDQFQCHGSIQTGGVISV